MNISIGTDTHIAILDIGKTCTGKPIFVTDFAKTLHLHASNFMTLGTHNLTSKEDIIFKFLQVIEQC